MKNKIESKESKKYYNVEEKYSYYYLLLAFHTADCSKQLEHWLERYVHYFQLSGRGNLNDAKKHALKLIFSNYYDGFFFGVNLGTSKLIINF